MDTDFLFRGGAFAPVPELVSGDWEQWLADNKFHLSQTVGDEAGLHYRLYEGEEAWLVAFGTAGRLCVIRCEAWPDLIELLAKLSPIALAAILDDEQIEAVGEALEPFRERVRRRRR